jgi:hypothetical protein
MLSASILSRAAGEVRDILSCAPCVILMALVGGFDLRDDPWGGDPAGGFAGVVVEAEVLFLNCSAAEANTCLPYPAIVSGHCLYCAANSGPNPLFDASR